MLRLKQGRVRDWTSHDGLVHPSSSAGLSFNNLLELHILSSLRHQHGLSLQRIRRALQELRRRLDAEHPLLDARFATDGIDLLLEETTDIINLSRSGQLALKEVVSLYLQRIKRDAGGRLHLYPFIGTAEQDAPEPISLSPEIAFGRPVLAGTAIAASVIAGRFAARDSVSTLAEEYGVSPEIIEDAIRWEAPQTKAA